jgi:acyl-CoA synthetase (NDP forming)
VVEGIDRHGARALVESALEADEDAWLDPATARELLQSYGVPVVAERAVASTDEALSAAREIGFPVVVKSAVPGAHKTETGGVALNLSDEAAVREAADGIGAPLIVQQMVEPAAELLAGIVQDPTFGPLVAFGPGGVHAELIGQASFRIAPLTDADANEVVHSGKAGKLVSGYRGLAPADTDALTDLLYRLSALGEDLPEVAELDLNPVIAGPGGCVAVDARVRVRRPEPAPHVKTW